jgi:RiboL-PSP-HEPN
MAYQDHFRLADDMVAHLDTIILGVQDPFITSRYVGFVSVAAVTVYELALKEIFCQFGEKKHRVLGNFTRSYFDRINGRIKISNICDEYIPRFGEKYLKRFKRNLQIIEQNGLHAHGISIRTSYSNVIEWRNSFAHQGIIPPFVTYAEVTQAYRVGKDVLTCLSDTMRW